MIMKRILLTIALITGLFFQHNLFATNPGPSLPPGDGQDANFWFYISVQVNTRDNIYRIVYVGSRIYTGTLKQFDKAVWRGLARRQLAIGPFSTREDAQKAQELYRIIMKSRTTDDFSKYKIPEYQGQVHWFALKITQSPRLHIYLIEHSPARVESGDAMKFLNTLFETLRYQQVVVGPFTDYQTAEEIKRIYRRNE